MYDDLSPGGQVLYAIARAFGARVTSGRRSAGDNAAIGGNPSSKHLSGDAIDIARDAPEIAVSMLRLFGKVYDEQKTGTAPHFHVEAHALTLPLLIGAVIGTARLLK